MGDIYTSIGNRIKAVRESLGLSQEQLAELMGFASPATISHFESGARKISIADLQTLASIVGIPVENFFASTGDDIQMQHFRLRASTVHPASQEVLASFLSFAAKHGEIPEQIPSEIRNLQPGAAAKKILEISNTKEPPVSPFVVAKTLKTPVFDWDFPDEISGLFVRENDKACIGVNQNHPGVRQRFTVAHELGHLIFHDKKDLFVDFLEMNASAASVDEEQQKFEIKANQFAADLLMPFDWIRADFREYGTDGISVMAQKYSVSEQALWVRLISMKLVERNSEIT